MPQELNESVAGVGAPTPAKATAIAMQDGSGNLQIVSSAHPLPITGGGSGSNAAAGPTGSAVPASADYLGFNSGGNLVGVAAASPLPTAPQSLPALAAGTNLIGQVSASDETSTIYNGTTALTPLFATVVASSSGVTNIVAAVALKKIRVVAAQLVANGAVNVKWQSHVTPTDITGLAYLAANGGYVLPYNPVGWFQTVSGEALDINLSGSVAVGGSITYVTV